MLKPKKPTLIKNLNSSAKVKVVNGMVYNPTLQVWEGNNADLTCFDAHPKQVPALITSMAPEIAHNSSMVFDPVARTWKGNDSDLDVFKDFEDFADSKTSEKKMEEFNLSKAEKEGFCISEASHKLAIGNWYPSALNENKPSRGHTKAYLYEIRGL